MTQVKPIPDGYHTVTPYLSIQGASEAIDFYQRAFGATEILRLPDGKGRVAHAELQIGDSRVMLADENTEHESLSPRHYGGTPVTLCVYVKDVDAVFARAVEAGAKVVRPLADQFYGDRTGGVEDPYGHRWFLMTHIKDVSPEEMQEAMAAMAAK